MSTGRINREWKANRFNAHLEYAGGDNAIGNYLAAPVDFSYTAPADRDVLIMHLAVVVSDAGTLDSGFYGNNITLVNGIRLIQRDAAGVETLDLQDGHVVYTNGDWIHHAEDLKIYEWGTGNGYYTAHFEAWNQVGVPYHLPRGHSMAMVLNDDFTGLIVQEFHLKGVLVK